MGFNDFKSAVENWFHNRHDPTVSDTNVESDEAGVAQITLFSAELGA